MASRGGAPSQHFRAVRLNHSEWTDLRTIAKHNPSRQIRRLSMSETQRDILSTCFSLAVILLAAFVTQRFFLPLVWAGIFCIATWPMFARILRSCGGRPIPAAIIATAISALISSCRWRSASAKRRTRRRRWPPGGRRQQQRPAAAGLGCAHPVGRPGDSRLVVCHARTAARHVAPAEDGSVGRLHAPAKYCAISARTCCIAWSTSAWRSWPVLLLQGRPGAGAQIERDGQPLPRAMARWERYAAKVPTAIRATVNGLVLVGLAEGVLLGIVYAVRRRAVGRRCGPSARASWPSSRSARRWRS